MSMSVNTHGRREAKQVCDSFVVAIDNYGVFLESWVMVEVLATGREQ